MKILKRLDIMILILIVKQLLKNKINYHTMINKNAQSIIFNYYQKDFKYFGYSFVLNKT